MPVAEHADDCPCCPCQCQRWLGYREPNDRDGAFATLKIAAFDGVGGGGGEPDRLYDRVVKDADMKRALRQVEPPFLQSLGWAHRGLPPLRRYRPDPGRKTRPARDVVRWLEGTYHHPKHEKIWGTGRWRVEWELAKQEHPTRTLTYLLELIAAQMAAKLGSKFGGEVLVAPPMGGPDDLPDPVPELLESVHG